MPPSSDCPASGSGDPGGVIRREGQPSLKLRRGKHGACGKNLDLATERLGEKDKYCKIILSFRPCRSLRGASKLVRATRQSRDRFTWVTVRDDTIISEI